MNVAQNHGHARTRSSGENLFASINAAARPRLAMLVSGLLPEGRREGNEWIARNPRRDDHRPGSFKVNLVTGRWADFASGDRGGDIISLVAYLRRLSQLEAARLLARELGARL